MSRVLPVLQRPAEAKDTRIKICGITRAEDARLAASLGADYLGLVFAPSPRRVDPHAIRDWVREVSAEYPKVRWVGVFVDASEDEIARVAELVDLDLVQVHDRGSAGPLHSSPAAPGATSGAPVFGRSPVSARRRLIVAVAAGELGSAVSGWSGAIAPDELYAFLVDSAVEGRTGGTGHAFDWSALPPDRPEGIFLAGGLSPENVADAIRAVRPFAVDASSRLEGAPGIKDPQRLRAFFEAIRAMAD